MQTTIKVTLGHIAKGCQDAPDNCPTFHALQDAGIDVISVRCSGFYYGSQFKWKRLPKVAIDAIAHYDKTGEMFPFEFEVEI